MPVLLRIAAIATLFVWPLAVHAQDATTASATAKMMDQDGKETGTVTFKTTPSGKIWIIAEMAGIAAGAHGFHIHETGKCDAADGFKSAGGHYTGDMKHGVMTEGGPHAGDLPNVNASSEERGEGGILQRRVFARRGWQEPARRRRWLGGRPARATRRLHHAADRRCRRPARMRGDRIDQHRSTDWTRIARSVLGGR